MNNKISILKGGNIYFFYRPKVGSREEIQRLFLVLSDNNQTYTSLIVGKKQLPENVHDKYLLFVEETNKSKQELLNSLPAKNHQVGKGETTYPETCCLAEGKFILAKHENHTHFIYQITNPSQLKEIQQEFNLQKEDDYLISVKNPEINPILNQKEKINYPKDLQEKFSNKHFIPLDPEFLKYQRTELLLINKAKKDLSEKEKDIKNCLEEINQADLTNEFAKVLSPKSIFPLQE